MTTSTASAPRTMAAPLDGIARVLVVDDEPAIREVLSLALGFEGFEVRTAEDGATAVAVARDFGPDAVLLDVMLPDMTGFEVLRRLRADDPALPVMFVTARDGEEDRVAGFAAGGDDYVTKPFSLADVVARLRRILRRRTPEPAGDRLLAVGDLVLDEESREVHRGGQEVRLSATEFELLRRLMRNCGRILSRDELFDWIWRRDSGVQRSVVEVYVCYLRRKLGDGRAQLIRTVRGAGYVLAPAS